MLTWSRGTLVRGSENGARGLRMVTGMIIPLSFIRELALRDVMRTNRHQYFLDLALRCAHQGTCLRRNFGAIIVDEYNTIVSTGYTGAPRKQMDCTELARCWRKDHNIPSGSNYERCRSVHAEMNALLQAGKLARGCTLYLAGYDVETEGLTQIWPCFLCSKMIVNSAIRNVIMRTGPEEYREMDPMLLYQMRSREALGDDEK